MLPVVIIAVVVIPLLVIAFVAARRSANAGEHPTTETDADRLRTEQEIEESERYQEEWREEQQRHPADTP
jgi:FtsZ-interacting cell division protein ZipA